MKSPVENAQERQAEKAETAKTLDISIIVPCRNEKDFIQNTVDNLLAQQGAGDKFDYEIIIVDGKSDDGTWELLQGIAANNPRIRVLVNEKKVTPNAVNIGIRAARGTYICRIDAHAEIADDYVLSCLETISKVDAEIVGGPWRAKGEGYLGEAIAIAFQSPFAVGGAKANMVDYEGYLDTVWCGFYKRKVFETVGLFDESFIRGQDAELNIRLIKSGGKVWQTPKIRYFYYCRN